MPEPGPTHNQIEYTVSEVANALKRTVEDTFGYVRVRGEISGFKVHTSGHAYLALKDEGAVLDAVCWKGNCVRLSFRPEDGLEVVATGKLTTYPGRSKYQIIIDRMEPAGAGALMALLEKRKRMLAAEGLFDAKRKRPLPFLPKVIGVVTSPTGAVIRDILHRIGDRFPVHVIVWPVPVQGEGAAEQIAAAIQGFNLLKGGEHGLRSIASRSTPPSKGGVLNAPVDKLPSYSLLPRPDLLIVARGGGSVEDLWAFNEEIVVRAAANSKIPLISAVGHETDWTLIDLVADRRAPTPTAAAEMAVPVRAEWLVAIEEYYARMLAAATRYVHMRAERVQDIACGLIHPRTFIDNATQRLDDWSERLANALPQLVTRREQRLALALASLRPSVLMQDVSRAEERAARTAERFAHACERLLGEKEKRLDHLARMLETVNVQRVLERGFVLVKDGGGKLVTKARGLKTGQALELQFADGKAKASVDG